jgi:hypothetical protein
MTTLTYSPRLTLSIQEQRSLRVDMPHCRFCGCTEENRCRIPIVETIRNIYRLARPDETALFLQPCTWFVDFVCTNPECMAKLLEELRNGKAA